jgi:hypothetical protein
MLITTMMTRHTISLPLATIARAEAMDGGDWLVTDSQGEQHRVDKVAWECAVEFTPAAMTQALPGTYLVSISEDESGNSKVWKSNVVGWMINAEGEVRPIVVDMSLITGGEQWHILHPDGRVERKSGESWETVDQWFADTVPVPQAAE